MLLLKLSLRNVFRNRRRSLITVSALSVGIMALIVVKGLTDGYGRQAQLNLINLEYGHLQVFAEGYYDNDETTLVDAMTDIEDALATIEAMEDVVAVTPRLAVQSLLNHQGSEMPAMAVGIDPDRDDRVYDLKPYLVGGEYLGAGAQAMIGDRMADILDVKVGDMVIWKARSMGTEGEGSIQAVYVEIKGILSTSDPAVDGLMIFMPLDFAQESLRAGGRATHLVVRLDDMEKVPEAKDRISEALGRDYEVIGWKRLAEEFFALYELDKFGNMIVVYVLMAIIVVGIVNTMLMATYERVREIGMMMALGMKSLEIRLLFLLEGALLGLFGSLWGIALGAPLTWLLEVYGLPMSWFTGGQEIDFGYPIRNVMYADLNLELVGLALVFGIVMATLASFWPAMRSSRLEPTEALRHV